MSESDNNISGSIDNPRLWRLALEIDTDAIRAVAYSTVEDNTLLSFAVPLDPTAASPLKALEDAVYSTPVLLSDFGKVDVVVRCSSFTVVPAQLDAGACRAAALCAGILDDDTFVLQTDVIEGADVKIVWTLEAGRANFLARTFRNPAVHHHLAPLARHFGRKTSMGNTGKTFVHMHSGATAAVDIVAYGSDSRLLLMTSKEVYADADALYFILAVLRNIGLNPAADEVLLCGDAVRREALMPVLRTYVASVMPLIFPSAAYRAGHKALSSPFPLVILPLCE